MACRMSLCDTRSTSCLRLPFPHGQSEAPLEGPSPNAAIISSATLSASGCSQNILPMEILPRKNCCILEYLPNPSTHSPYLILKHKYQTINLCQVALLPETLIFAVGSTFTSAGNTLHKGNKQQAECISPSRGHQGHSFTWFLVPHRPITQPYHHERLAFLSMANWMPLASLSPSSWSLRMISAIKRSATFLKPASSLNLSNRNDTEMTIWPGILRLSTLTLCATVFSLVSDAWLCAICARQLPRTSTTSGIPPNNSILNLIRARSVIGGKPSFCISCIAIRSAPFPCNLP